MAETQISIPGWDDIVHIRPRHQFNEVEQAELRLEHKDRNYDNLTARGMEELERRREVARRIRKSPAPGWARSLGSVMTWIDDVEDGIITAAVIGRILIKAAPRLLSRFIPLVGWAFLAADAFNLFSLLGRTALTPMLTKRQCWDAQKINPFSKKSRFKQLARVKSAQHGETFWKVAKKLPILKKFGNVIPTLGESLEIAQTTDQLFGVGLCLGPLMGVVVDAHFKAYEYAEKAWPYDPFSLPARVAGRILLNSPLLNSAGGELAQEDHTRIIIGTRLALDMVTPTLHASPWTEYADILQDVPIQPSIPSDPCTLAAISDLGLNVPDVVGFPFEDEPAEIYPCEPFYRCMGNITNSYTNYALKQSNSDDGCVAGSCVEQVPGEMVKAYERENYQVEESTDDLNTAIRQIVEKDLLPTWDDRELRQEQTELDWQHGPHIIRVVSDLVYFAVIQRIQIPFWMTDDIDASVKTGHAKACAIYQSCRPIQWLNQKRRYILGDPKPNLPFEQWKRDVMGWIENDHYYAPWDLL